MIRPDSDRLKPQGVGYVVTGTPESSRVTPSRSAEQDVRVEMPNGRCQNPNCQQRDVAKAKEAGLSVVYCYTASSGARVYHAGANGKLPLFAESGREAGW